MNLQEYAEVLVAVFDWMNPCVSPVQATREKQAVKSKDASWRRYWWKVIQCHFRRINRFVALLGVAVLIPGCSTTHHSLAISEIAPGVYDGRKPRSEADFKSLREKGIKTIVNLQTMTWDIEPERKHALKNGFAFVNIPITASPFGPREEKVQRLFETMAAATNQPVYVHCLLGRDRTGVLMALYRVYYESCSPEDAWAEMIHRGGFKSSWALVGFRMYFWRHCDPPKWVKQSPRSLRAELPRN